MLNQRRNVKTKDQTIFHLVIERVQSESSEYPRVLMFTRAVDVRDVYLRHPKSGSSSSAKPASQEKKRRSNDERPRPNHTKTRNISAVSTETQTQAATQPRLSHVPPTQEIETPGTLK